MHQLSPGAALALRELAILIDEGRLEVRQCPKLPDGLRLAIDPARATGWLVHSSHSNVAVMENLLPGVVRRRKLDETSVRPELASVIQTWPPVKTILGWSAAETAVTTYRIGQRRRFEQDFRDIQGAKIDRIDIRDPYALAQTYSGDNIDSVAALLGILSKVSAQAIDRVRITTRPASGDGDRRNLRLRKEVLEDALKQEGLDGLKPEVSESRDREFHDRWIDIAITRPTRQAEMHSYSLSGGVARYMDPGRETVFVHLQQKVTPRPAAQKPTLPPAPRPRGR